ncbi:MAG: TraY domain-containing protein [Deltaproteobacteria bacterium]|nr:TraY domain-containing protein [Deltaproteobacteria bacterium]RLB16214.1 MAG: CopG family transcriptional regulator [Deltaproteobacteria bacterium]
MLALRLPPDIEKRLDALARKTGRTKSFYGREAILRHLDDLEDMYLAEKILDRIKSNKERTFTIDEVERELGLED